MITDQDNDDEQHEATTSSSSSSDMITMRSDALIGHAPYEQSMNITLSIWQWIAISKIAEHRALTTSDLLARWISARLDQLATHVAEQQDTTTAAHP